jgi:putative transposase
VNWWNCAYAWQWRGGTQKRGCFTTPIAERNLPGARYQAALREVGIEVSMSRTGNCWDNAAMEAFFATLTKECVNRKKFQTRQEARSTIFEYIECFYNPVRLHSTLQYVSPIAFEQAYVSENVLVVHKP